MRHDSNSRRNLSILAWRRQNHDLRAALAQVEDELAPARLNIRNLAVRRRSLARRTARRSRGCGAVACVGRSGGLDPAWLEQPPPPGRGIDALAQEAAAGYAVCAPNLERPIEIPASDLAALDQWVSRRMGRPVRAPDLSGSGFRLVGGRLVATPNGPAGMFLYQATDGARVAMLVRPMEIDKTASMRRRVEGATEGYA
ncbi:hypothetical protein [Brevundimonas sp.]|uniref:hypothetical protein n=1 Tax=Brevundimonas sp. TaxID=1871086 RepID=UPI00289BFAB9|nr:hypothetical protein [Brevundimonas sp.]